MTDCPIILWRPSPLGPEWDDRHTASCADAAAAYLGCRAGDVARAIRLGVAFAGGFFADFADPRQVEAETARVG
jgi:hypothetical protein